MSEFIRVTDMADGARVLVNIDDISRIESRNAGCAIYFRRTADDVDGTNRQVVMYTSEDFDYVESQIRIPW